MGAVLSLSLIGGMQGPQDTGHKNISLLKVMWPPPLYVHLRGKGFLVRAHHLRVETPLYHIGLLILCFYHVILY